MDGLPIVAFVREPVLAWIDRGVIAAIVLLALWLVPEVAARVARSARAGWAGGDDRFTRAAAWLTAADLLAMVGVGATILAADLPACRSGTVAALVGLLLMLGPAQRAGDRAPAPAPRGGPAWAAGGVRDVVLGVALLLIGALNCIKPA